jgi:hypothetical protein
MAGATNLRTFHNTVSWNSEHFSTVLRELVNTSICLPEIGFGNWNYSGCVEPLRAASEYGACLIDTAVECGTEETDLLRKEQTLDLTEPGTRAP